MQQAVTLLGMRYPSYDIQCPYYALPYSNVIEDTCHTDSEMHIFASRNNHLFFEL